VWSSDFTSQVNRYESGPKETLCGSEGRGIVISTSSFEETAREEFQDSR